MALRAAKYKFKGTSTPVSSYNKDKINYGALCYANAGAAELDNWVGANPIGVARPMEMAGGFAAAFPHIIQFKPTEHYVFVVENATAAATRKVGMFTYNPQTSQYSWRGFITLTYPTATNHTIRGFRMDRLTYSTGTVAVSATAVTGTNTNWTSVGKISVGARIGFGTTDPAQVTNWYNVSAIASDTGITLSTTAGTIAAGTAYVLEEYRAITVTTNATTTNGGVYVAKGLHPDIFIPAGTTISAATTADAQRLVYWLADASTVTNTVAGGCAIEDPVNATTRYIYVSDGASTTAKFFKYNVRADLASLSSGKSVSAYVLATGTQAVTGNMSQSNNGRVGILNHGPGSGVNSLYFCTTTRVYRAALTNITNASVSFLSDNMVENPKGGTSTYPASGGISQLEIADAYDKLVIVTNTTGRHYVTQYRTDGGQFDYNFGMDSRQTDIGAVDSGSVPHFSQASTALSIWSEAGVLHVCKNGTTAATNQMYALPFAADWNFAATTNNRIISPKIALPNAVKLDSLVIQTKQLIGSNELGLPPEPCRSYIRTSGMDDNSGGWTLVGANGDISGSTAAEGYVQVALEFRTIGYSCISSQVLGLLISYYDDDHLDNYRPSASLSDATNKRFAFRFATAFGGTVPALRIRIYDDVSGALLVNDTTASPTGTWEKSTNDGSNWSAYNTTDKANETTYIRYTPASLATGIVAKAIITLV